MATYTDDFERASLGANWSTRAGTPQIYGSSDFGGGTIGTINLARWAGTAVGNDQSAEITAGTIANGEQIVCVRINASGPLAYYQVAFTGSYFELGKVVGGSWSFLADLGAVPSVGDTVRLEAEGTTIRAYKNDVLVGSVTDSSIASGQPGLGVWHGSVTPTSRIEAWEGADLGGGDVFAAASLMGSGTVATVAAVLLAGAAALSGAGALAAVARVERSAQCAISASGSLAAAARLDLGGRAVLSGTASVSPSAVVTYAGAAALSGVATITPRASVGDSLLLTTLKGAGDWGDDNDATKNCVNSDVIFSPPLYIQDLPALTCGAIGDSTDLGPIGYVVLRVRVRETNPVTGPDDAILASHKIRAVQDHPAPVEIFYTPASGKDWTDGGTWQWAETSPLTVALDGQPWDWARVNSLRAVGAWGQWYCDLDPGGPTTAELCLSEVEVLVYGPGGGEIFAEASLAGAGSVAAAGVLAMAGQAAMVATGALSAGAVLDLAGAALLIGTATLSAIVIGPEVSLPREPHSPYWKDEMRFRTGIDFDRRPRG